MHKIYEFVGRIRVWITSKFLKIKEIKCKTIEDYVKISYSPFSVISGLKPVQIKWEISKLLKLLTDFNPKVVCEIGTAQGGTLYLFSKCATSDAIIISIDLPGGPFGGGYCEWKIPFYKSFAVAKQKMYLIRGDSHYSSTLEELKEVLGDKKIDFLFIDGDHTFDGVKLDFENYSRFVKPGGIIALHDIMPNPREPQCQVYKFWRKIRYKYKYLEIVYNKNQQTAGIGVVYLLDKDLLARE